jgi:hypothetical protein
MPKSGCACCARPGMLTTSGNSSKYHYINDSSGDAYKYLHKPEGAGAIGGNLSNLSGVQHCHNGEGNVVDDPGHGIAEVSDVW